MTARTPDISVKRPQCGHIYSDWYRPSVNHRLDHFSDE